MKVHRFISVAGMLAAAFLMTALSTGCKSSSHLTADLTLDRDSLLVQTIYFHHPSFQSRTDLTLDTVVLKNGHFTMSFADSVPALVYLFPKPHNPAEMADLFPASLLILPGDHVHISGTLDRLERTGSELYDALNGTAFYKAYQRMELMNQMLAKEYRKMDPARKQALAYLMSKSDEFSRLYIETATSFVREEPSNIASAFAILFLPEKESVEMAELLDKKVLEGPMKPILDQIVGLNRQSYEKVSAWEDLKEGTPAPDFRLKNLDGKEKTLADFRGKYVVLDFWGSWCSWCMQGMPDMKKYYDRYHRDVEFIGIDCGDGDKEWRAAVKKNGMKWTQLFNGESDVVLTAYGISGFPTKLILDREGRVVAKFEGESEDFYNKLDELFR